MVDGERDIAAVLPPNPKPGPVVQTTEPRARRMVRALVPLLLFACFTTHTTLRSASVCVRVCKDVQATTRRDPREHSEEDEIGKQQRPECAKKKTKTKASCSVARYAESLYGSNVYA